MSEPGGVPESAAARWERLSPWLDELLTLAPPAREARLAAIAGDDPALAGELAGVLAAVSGGGDPLARPAAEVAALLVEGHGEDGEGEARQALAELHAAAPGGRLGPYRLVGELGRGGMGTVYLGERADRQFEQQVAIKLVQRGLEAGEALRRFARERQILARLEHPHVARLLDGGVTLDGRPWFAMELVRGRPLVEWASERGLAAAARLRLFVDVCEAVAYAHRNLVVHRDLKPSNVLVDEEGTVKLLDFGIAKLLGEEAASDATLTTLPPMTPAYAAPEQLAGETVSTLTDVYQLGLLLEELLTGRFADRTRPPALRGTASAGMVRDLERIASRARHEEPERRYPSAEALADDVRRLLDGRPVLARGDALGYRLGKLLRRHRAAAALAAVALLALVGGLGVALWQARRADREASAARADAQRATAVKEFLVELFTGNDPDRRQGREVSARELLDRGAAHLDQRFAEEPALRAELLAVVGELYHQLGEYDQALALRERELAAAQRLAEPLAVARAQVSVAQMLAETDQLERALAMAQSGHAALLSRVGADHLDTLDAEAMLAGVLRRQGDYERAEHHARHVLERTRALLPAGDPRVITALDDLALVLYDGDHAADAEPLLREALALAEGRGGEPSLQAVAVLDNLAAILEDLGEYPEAEALNRRSIAERERLLGEDHPRLAWSWKNLGGLLLESGRFAEAREALDRALQIFRRSEGEDSAAYANAFNALAIVDYQQGAYRTAARELAVILTLYERLFGPDHPTTTAVRANLGAALGESGDLAAAEPLLRRALAASRGPDRPVSSLAARLSVLGEQLRLGGRLDEALALHREGTRVRAASFGADDPQTAFSLYNEALVLRDRGGPGDAAAAAELLAQARARFDAQPDDNPPNRASVLLEIGRAALVAGDAAAALPDLDAALALRRKAFGERHWRVAEALLLRGRALAALGRSEEARKELEGAREALAGAEGLRAERLRRELEATAGGGAGGAS